ncbi:ATP-grasp domain-containing protein [Candidimonas humi]|uniref:ATP-grasp domain-containing protein n=1 Tax=Candidimonas humi TaxID=683355 RepID=A0ABV8P332_9BURK|nr:ATP-grasp domain-containing protein [Candidimonas humi]MBV6306911.1 ATP-grasp domain-containing protein [Candidimonas humi]
MTSDSAKGDTWPPAGPVAVLYESIEAPAVGNVHRSVKRGGYADSGADIAFALRAAGVEVRTPAPEPAAGVDTDWVYPDSIEGIQAALDDGARVLWANTVLFKGHPLESFLKLARIVGQLPERVQSYDDKWVANELLRRHGLPVAPSVLVGTDDPRQTYSIDAVSDSELAAHGLHFPLVVKPLRGRGSQGVFRVDTLDSLRARFEQIMKASEIFRGDLVPVFDRSVIVEQFLPGEELAVAVMPPGTYRIQGEQQTMAAHWSLPAVQRCRHEDGVAPYDDAEPLASNSKPLDRDAQQQPALRRLLDHCARAAALVDSRAPIRIDCRAGKDGKYYLFDLNMKPNLTGPGRPDRDNRDSLIAMAARAAGWSYTDLLLNMLAQSWTQGRK